MATRADIVAAARAYLGVRWCHQGRNRAGLDCIGLVIAVAHDLSLSQFDTRDYDRIPDGKRLRAGMMQHLQLTHEQQPGDVLLMRYERFPLHLGFVTDVGLLHAYANMRRVVEHRMDAVWQARVVSVFRFPGVA